MSLAHGLANIVAADHGSRPDHIGHTAAQFLDRLPDNVEYCYCLASGTFPTEV